MSSTSAAAAHKVGVTVTGPKSTPPNVKPGNAPQTEGDGTKDSRWRVLMVMILLVAFVLAVSWLLDSGALDAGIVAAFALLAIVVAIFIVLLWERADQLISFVKTAIHFNRRKELRAAIATFKNVLQLSIDKDQGRHPDEVKYSQKMLEDADASYDQGDVDVGWKLLSKAKTKSLFLLNDQDQIQSSALETMYDGIDKLSSWRLDAVKELLQDKGSATKIKSNVSVQELFTARSILEEHIDHYFEKLGRAAWQLYILIAVAFSCLAVLAIAVPRLSGGTPNIFGDGLLVVVVMFVGALGGVAGGFWSLLSMFAVKDTVSYEQVFNSWLVAVRPLFGAVFSFAAAFFLLSGLLNLGTLTLELLLSASFLAGASEELVLNLVKKIAGGSAAKGK